MIFDAYFSMCREKAVALAEKRGLEKLKQGAQAREKWEQGRIDVRANEVLHVQVGNMQSLKIPTYIHF